MAEFSIAQIKQVQDLARANLETLKGQYAQYLEKMGASAVSAAEAAVNSIAVSGQASFGMAFIYGTFEFIPDQLGLKYKSDALWGVGLTGGTSYVTGVIEEPHDGEAWDCNVNNTPGVATGLFINFFKNGAPVGSLAGPALSGGLGMVTGGSGQWEDK